MKLGLLVQRMRHSLEFYISPFDLSLLGKDVYDELESSYRVENFVTLDEFTLINHFHVKNVIHEADQ